MPQDDRDDQDRVVSRRVRNPTEAGPDDESVYQAADPLPDDSSVGGQAKTSGSTTEAAAAELSEENESEPTRSE